MTSNNYDSLDSRLKRTCRIDLTLEINTAGSDALLDFVRYVYSDESIQLPDELVGKRFLGCDVYDTNRNHPTDVSAFFAEIRDFAK